MNSPPRIMELWEEILVLSSRLRDMAEEGAIPEIAGLLEKRQALINQVSAHHGSNGKGEPTLELERLVRETLQLQRETENLLEKRLAGLTADLKGIDLIRRRNLSYLKSMVSGEPLILDRRD